jgi:hypothetical protein
MGTFKLRLKRRWLAALLAAAIPGLDCQVDAASCTPAATGLIGWWPGDGNANDLTGANNGILQGGASAATVGFDGLAFSFDGTNSYVQIPDALALRPTNFTIEAWVSFNSLDSAGLGGSPAGDQYLVFRQNTRSDNFEGFDLGKTRIVGGDVFRLIVAPQTGAPVEIQSATFIATNVWYHIAAVRGTNYTQLYVNGALERQATVTFPQDYGNFPLYFGSSGQTYWDHKFKGTLDEVAIYSRALSPGEIGAIYATGSAGKCKGVTITGQPQSQNVSVGSSVLFSVAANGFGALSYQWQFNGGSIFGATGTDLTLTNVQAANAGNYSVVVSNFAGAVTSAVAVLTLNAPISCASPAIGLISWWPGDGTANDVAGGNNGTLQGGASASAPGFDGSAFSFDGTNSFVQIPDAPALRPTNLTIEAWVRFSSLDSAGSGGSPAGDQYIVFKQNSRSGDFEGYDLGKTRIGGSDYFQFIVSSASGQSAHLESVTAVSIGVWYHVAAVRDPNFIRLFVNAQLEGQASITFPQDYGNFPLFFGSSGQAYWDRKFKGSLDEVSLYDHALSASEIGAIYSAGAAGKCKGASITAQPQNQTVVVAANAQFSVGTAGLTPLRYQWRFNGANMLNATNASLAINNVQLSDAGNYAVVVTNGLGGSTSFVAVLTVLVPPSITAQPQSRTNVMGTIATFSAGTSGSAPLVYQWQFNGGNIAGATDANFALANVQPTDAGNYRVVVANSAGVVTSSVAVLTVLVPPSIASQPQSRTNVVGTSAAFIVAAYGTVPLGYQWQFNGANIGGATGATFTIGNVQSSDAGSYAVVVTNSAGSVTSALAVLTVWVPPTITAQPQSRTNVAGTSAAFSVVASGTTPLSYQWQFNGANIPGATGASLTLNNVQASDAGSYTVGVTNAAGSITSAVAVLTVWVPPNISTQPQSRTNVAGTSALFTVAANGTAPLGYQWQFNGANVGGATGATITIGNVQSSDAGNYAAVVANSAGSVTSALAVLTVLVPPAITLQPQSRTNVAGTSALFSIVASGTAPLSYQWQFNGANVPGGTGASLALNDVQASDAGNYAVVVTNVGGSITSAVAVLTVWVAPNIASQPQSQTNVVGTSAAFSVGATGTAPLSYQWQFNSANIGGATGANLTLANVQLSDAGIYAVVVTNSAGSVTSAVATLTVWAPPAITSQPQSRTNAAGTTAEFSVGATGTLPLGYQWQFNGANVPGGTGANLTLNNVQLSDAGNYAAVITNGAGSVTSAVASLTVLAPPSITSPPQNRTNISGSSATFSVIATGTAPLSYQWQRAGENISGATGTSLLLSNVQPGDAGSYSVVVTNTAGSVTSAVAVLTVWNPPSISTQPQSRTNLLGTTAVFSVLAGGTTPLSYQWQFNGGSIVGATGTSLTLNAVQANDAGNYSVVVMNGAGSVTSAVATLTVWVTPAITVQPHSRTNVVGTVGTFSVTATGTAPLNYQWQLNGANIANATSSVLTLTNIQVSDTGNYSVVVTNVAGSATSIVAVLTVLTPPSITTQPQNCTNVLGTTVIFSANSSGTAPLNYQWQFNGALIGGASDPVLILKGVQAANAGRYALIVTNLGGAATSSVATLTVLLPPTFTTQPRSRTNVAFVTSAFSATANGTSPFEYQWRFNGVNIAGASGSTLILNNAQLGNSGNYDVVVTNIAAAATSTVATLTVIPPSDCVTAPPGLVGWWPGEGNANDIAGTNNGSLQGGAIASVAGVAGSGVAFDGANGFVQIPDAAALKPANLTVLCWVRFDLMDSAGNTPSPGQQFIVFKQNSRASGFEGFLLSKERVAGRDVLSWTVTSVTGQSARLNSVETIVPGVWYHVGAVRGPDFIRLYMNGQLDAVTNVSFPQDYGNFPLYFGSSGQPSFDRKLAGALDEVSLCNRALGAGEIAVDYFAGINGKCKSPKFLTQPRDTAGYWGGSVSFTSAATGALPLKYQWRKNGLALPSATNSFLLLSNLQPNDGANYALFATNSFGSTSSDSAQLKVYVADVAIGQLNVAGTQTVAALSISGITGRLYGIQVTPSLGPSNHWTGLTNIVLTTPTVAWFDPQSATQAQRYYRIVPGPIAVWDGTWETSDIGAVWSDDFNRAALGSNWVILGSANASITNNELQFAQINTDFSRQVYYQPWLTSSDEWTIRWTQRFGALDATSYGIGVGIKNFQAAGGNDRGYNGLLLGTGPDIGKMQISRFDGGGQQPAAAGNPISIASGNIIDCSLTRSGWTMTATASNRANAQVSTSTMVFSDPSNLIAPTISRICFYPLGGTVYVDNISYTINHRKPARYIVLGASASDGYNASSAARRYISVVQSNFFEVVCNDSSSYNTTTNAVSIMPEILAHQPTTAILMIGGNDLAFGYPPAQWQTQYSNLVAQLQMNGITVKHTFQTPRNNVDLRPLKDWIAARYPAGDIIDTWTPFVTNAYSLKPIYDSGDGIHPNDAGHLLLGQIIRTNLP